VVQSLALLLASFTANGDGNSTNKNYVQFGWTTGRSRFDPRQKRKDFFCSLCVQTGSGAHPASCTMGTGGTFPEVKAWPGRDADHSPHLVPRSRMSRSYTSSLPSSFAVCSGTALAFLAYTPAFHGETEKKQDKPQSRQSVFRI
jgi:hypothetical protein